MCLSAPSLSSSALISVAGCFANLRPLSLSSDLNPACAISRLPSALSLSQDRSTDLSEFSADNVVWAGVHGPS